MLYGLFRIMFLGIVFTPIFLIMKKRRLIKTKLIALMFWVLAVMVCTPLMLLPVENLVISFKSPENVFR